MTFDWSLLFGAVFCGLGIGFGFMAGEGRAHRRQAVTMALHVAGVLAGTLALLVVRNP